MKSQFVEEFAADMDRIGAKLGTNNADALKYCAKQIIAPKVADNFNSGSTAGGTPWPPHAPSTVRRYGPHPLLILSGAMSEAATIEGASGHVERIDEQGLDFGVSLDTIPYARVHQQGYPEKNIPQREYMAVSADELDDMGNALAEFGMSDFE